MANEYVNKVVLGSSTLIDLTNDTVTAESLAQGYTAHDKSGAPIVGTATGGSGAVYQDEDGYLVLSDEGGGQPAPQPSGSMSDPIRFFDYDGRLVASYTSVPSAMPDVPTHDRLTNGTWNYTLSQVADQFSAMGTCDVGANYDTASGKTEIDVELDSDHLEPYLCVAVNGTATVDWGDGSSTDTITGTDWTTLKPTPHVYAQAGDYTISIDGAVGFYGGSSAYPGVLRGHGVTSGDRQYDREYCVCVKAIRVAGGSRIGDYAFSHCHSLQSASVPTSVTSIGTYAFSDCYSLQSASVPAGVTSIGNYAFRRCYSLKVVSIPASATSIGNYALQYCCSLRSVSIPAGVTRIGGSAFYCCYSLQSVSIPAGATSTGSYAFYECYSLQSVRIQAGVTSVDSYSFYECHSLQSVSIPASATSIGSSAFYCCYSLRSVSIPAGVTSIGSTAFNSCYGTYEYHLRATVPPTLASTNVFNNILAGTTIYVPKGCLEAYQTATNWSTYADYMVEEEA